jgi:hypothetical protein
VASHFLEAREKSYKHLKALYLKGYINGHPVNKILVDTGALVNIMPYSVLRRLGRYVERRGSDSWKHKAFLTWI